MNVIQLILTKNIFTMTATAVQSKTETACYACPLPPCCCHAPPPMTLASLATHCQAEHPEYYTTAAARVVPLGGHLASWQWVVGALGLGALFHVLLEWAWGAGGGVYASVCHLGPPDQAAHYAYEVELSGARGGLLRVPRRVHGEQSAETQDCFSLSRSIVLEMFGGGDLYIKITITRH